MDKIIFTTAGDGLWSDVAKSVEITSIEMGYVADEKDFGELRVYFNTGTWDIKQDGLIYTDGNFLFELQAFLDLHGIAGSDVDYSEQGMQGEDYVSLDVGKAFLDSWAAKFNTPAVA